MINQKLVDHLINGSTLLTPTSRLASRLLTELNEAFSLRQRVWSTPRIYALDDWFKRLWSQFEIEGKIDHEYINPMQSLLRWEEIIQACDKGKTLFQPHVTAKTAFAAWKTCHQWLALVLLDEKTDNIEVNTFQTWAKSYQSWLSTHHYIDSAQRPMEILKLLKARGTQPPLYVCENKKIILFGFEEFSPFLLHFFETMAKEHWEIHYEEPEPLYPAELNQIEFATMMHECKAAAIWARDRLREQKKNIAIVTPHLTTQRHKIEDIFNNCLTPLQSCQPQAQINSYFNISTAIPLIQYPIIHAALESLRLGTNLSLNEYIEILTSCFTKAGNVESEERASYAFWLKSQHTPFEMGEQYLKCHSQNRPVIWGAMMHDVVAFIKDFPQYASFNSWAENIRTLLNLLGWPGDRALNSIEHQAVKRWEDLLNELNYCDTVLPLVPFSKALLTLQKLAANVPFQAENKGAPIQILGILEAAGQHFDHLWVMGLHSHGWPAMAMPNPFLPLDYQRQHQMPHASAQRELGYAKKVTARLQQSAKEVIFSYARQENERTLEPSELIRHLPKRMLKEQAHQEPIRAEDFFCTSIKLEENIDNKAPPYTEDENLRFNSHTLTLQSNCPFKAFAQIRLKADEPRREEVWLTPQQQGTLIHQILEQFWQGFKNQAALLAEPEENVDKKIEDLITFQLKKMIRTDTPHIFIQVEKKRLHRLLKDYLRLEKERAPFEIASLESQKSLYLSGLHFILRLDRVDKNQEGDFYIIDYKTGQFRLSDLWGERPKLPQIPLYYLSAQDLNPKALFVTKIQSGGCEFEGISKDFYGIPGIKKLDEIKEMPLEWEQLKAYWTDQLTSLAIEFKEGEAQVAPLEDHTCQYCHLKPFCRVGELA